jgi:hypothetical protein
LPSSHEERQEQQLKKMELEVKELKTYILTQKNLDSLHHPTFSDKILKQELQKHE